jgi:hypothetical protein
MNDDKSSFGSSILLSQIKLILTPTDVNKHFKNVFSVTRKYSRLFFKVKYGPKIFTDLEAAKKLVIECARVSCTDPAELMKDAENLKNLITISIDSPVKYLGAAHRHDNEIIIIISSEESSEGFLRSKIIKGEWNVTVSTHCVLSERVDFEVEIRGI